MYASNQLRGKKGGLFRRLGRGSTDARNALRPPEPRAAELIYRSWVRSVWKIWTHIVRSELASLQQHGGTPDLAGRMYALLNGSGLNGVLTRVGQAVTDNVARYMRSIFKPGLHVPAGVRLDAAFESIPRLKPFNATQAAQIDAWRLENLRLIKNATDEHIAALFKIFKDSQEQGIAHGELAGMVDKVLNDGYQRALLIASDQTTKFNGTIQRAQQTSAGITEFVWSTSHDGAVRPTHRALDGKKFSWAVGAPDGDNLVLPGEPIRCRCQAIPVIDMFADLEEAAPSPAAVSPAVAAVNELGVSNSKYLREGLRPASTEYAQGLFAGMTQQQAQQYATEEIEPIRVELYPDVGPALGDGRHRMLAARAAGATHILAHVVEYGKRGGKLSQVLAKVRI